VKKADFDILCIQHASSVLRLHICVIFEKCTSRPGWSAESGQFAPATSGRYLTSDHSSTSSHLQYAFPVLSSCTFSSTDLVLLLAVCICFYRMNSVTGNNPSTADIARCLANVTNDNSFGPAVHSCQSDFDFTLVFEQSILSIIPSALLLLFVPWRAWHLWGRTAKAKHNNLTIVKQVHACISPFVSCVMTVY
jgi:hypothetical protein